MILQHVVSNKQDECDFLNLSLKILLVILYHGLGGKTIFCGNKVTKRRKLVYFRVNVVEK